MLDSRAPDPCEDLGLSVHSILLELPLATHSSASKAHKQSLVRRARNRHYRSMTRKAIKRFNAALEAADKEAVTTTYKNAERILRRVAGQGVLKPQAANRTISRLSRKLNQALASK